MTTTRSELKREYWGQREELDLLGTDLPISPIVPPPPT